MFSLTTFIFCIIAAQASASSIAGGRIIGGGPVDISKAPWNVVVLHLFIVDGNITYHQHGAGSIISPRIILTSASNINNWDKEEFNIRAGANHFLEGGQLIELAEMITHPGYNATTLKNDIGALILAKPLVLGDKVAKVTLPSAGTNVPYGSTGQVTGWGLDVGDVRPGVLQSADIPIQTTEVCKQLVGDVIELDDNMFCAGAYEEEQKGPCKGDRGGPLVVQNVLTGVTSWGTPCAVGKLPWVFTKVSNYIQWIEALVEKYD